MSRVAEDIRREQLARFRAMTPAERVALAQRLGDEGLATIMESRGLTRGEALKEIRRSRRAGRKPSRSMDER